MPGFEDRENAFENKFAHDQEQSFKIEARACKLFGLWAAEQMGLKGPQAEAYAKEIVSANLEEAGLDDVRRKAATDFAAKKLSISAHVIDRQLEKFMQQAAAEIVKNPGK